MLNRKYAFFFLLIVLTACSTLKDSQKNAFGDGGYEFRQQGAKYRKVLVYVNEDSVKIFGTDEPKELLVPDRSKDQFFVSRSFDIDLVTMPFKFRPIATGFPRQLTTEFNGNVFVGYRIDRFLVKNKETPFGWKKSYKHRGVTVGGVAGLGTTFVAPWTTNYLVTDEYNGFILSRGVAAMVGLNNLTFGVSVGWDYLTDRDKDFWIYQNKPWIGFALGLNLN